MKVTATSIHWPFVLRFNVLANESNAEVAEVIILNLRPISFMWWPEIRMGGKEDYCGWAEIT